MTEDNRPHPGRMVARELMLEQVRSVRENETLDDARRALVGVQADADRPNAVLVVDEGGKYAGILTARLLLKHLIPEPLREEPPTDDLYRWRANLIGATGRHASQRIGDILADLPVVAPDDGLALLIKHGCEHRMEFIPVVDHGRPLGVVPITAVFTAAAALALRPDDEGIQVRGSRVK